MLNIVLILSNLILIGLAAVLVHRNIRYRTAIPTDVKDALLSPEELERHGRELASSHLVSTGERSARRLLARLENNYRFIIKTYRELNAYMLGGRGTVPAAEWLFDNFYIIEEQVKAIRINFPKGYYAALPRLENGFLRKYPRAYSIAFELVSHTDGRVDERVLINFIKSYQSKSQLTSGELWAVPIMLRIALIENIRRLCENILGSQKQKENADRLYDMVVSQGDGNNERAAENIKTIIKGMDILSPSFSEHLLKRARKNEAEAGIVMHFMDEKLAEQDTTAEEIIQLEHQLQAKSQVSIGNSITSLRMVSTLEWPDIFELLSPVEQVLKNDPAGVYSEMDFTSRDYYRHVIERKARLLKISESQVARKAVECAENGMEKDDIRVSHAGYYLMDKGRDVLDRILGYKPSIPIRFLRFIKSHPTFIYIWSVGLITMAVSAALALYGYYQSGKSAYTAF
jgi:hypothetical protein